MDGVPGVDVSWLHHHSNKGARPDPTTQNLYGPRKTDTLARADYFKAEKPVNKSPPQQQASSVPNSPPSTSHEVNGFRSANPSNESPEANQTSASSSHIPFKPSSRKGLLYRTSSEKLATASACSPEEARSPKRPGWISSLSSRFSSSQTNAHTLSAPSPSPSKFKTSVPTTNNKSPAKEAPSAQADRADQAEDFEPYVPQQPKSGNFFSSAIRRLSSASQTGSPVKAAFNGSTCPRKILNVDVGRERTRVKELEQKRLRRVAFSVDVEVVGVSRYGDSEEPVDAATQAKDKKLQARSEGDALKHPRALDEQRQMLDASRNSRDRSGSGGSVDELLESEMVAAAKQQEAEAARQRRAERKERKRQEVEMAGISKRPDVEAALEPTATRARSPSKPPIDGDAPPKSHDRPTTDPLRMYRRCCQLREAPVLKRISEQLGKAKSEVEKTGIVENLDLTGSRLQLPDFVCLSDWLAIMPVRRLQLDNANLTDESIRIILAGVLAVRPPNSSRRKHARSSPTRPEPRPIQRSPGVIEKISLRMNNKITSEGWRHVSLFLNLSHSLKAIDLAMTPFPATQSLVMSEGAKESPEQPESNPGDVAHVLSVALSTRSKESRLEELILSQCGLNNYTVSKITEALTGSSINRLGLANNQLSHEALEHVVVYMQSGSCLGLDLGGNDLRDATSILTKALTPQCPLWVLCLADCNLDAPSLSRLMPALLPLTNFRFLDLSHNYELFSQTPNAVGLLRRYLPQLKALRRLQLSDTSMLPEQAIAIAEVIPDIRNLNHVSFLNNPELSRLASASTPDTQEDSCAYYASLMWAARLSKTMLAMEIDLPTSDTNEVIQALGKQIDAYLFRNIDRCTASGAIVASDPYSVIPDSVDPSKEVTVPDVLAHLVGHNEDTAEDIDDDLTTGPDQDYIVGGTGVVKALSYVLSQKAADLVRSSANVSGNVTPTHNQTYGTQQEAGKVRARELSKNMLGSARKIRCRLRIAMQKEQTQGDEYTRRELKSNSPPLTDLLTVYI